MHDVEQEIKYARYSKNHDRSNLDLKSDGP
jgi:hypothetical protein